MGLDHEEVLQLVYLRLLRSNRGRSPFDPRKSSLGHYLYIVIDSQLKNMHKAQRSPKYASESLGGDEDVAAWEAVADPADDPRDALDDAEAWEGEASPTFWRRSG